jgi:hypothetical protein
MSSLPASDAVPADDAVRAAASRLRESLAVAGLDRAVAAYFDPEAEFSGMTFTTLGANPRDEVTTDDLLAVALLNITWRPDAVRGLLGTWAEKVSQMLTTVRSDIDLWDASDGDLAAVDPLWDALVDMPGVGTSTTAKLLARKRPRLCPITDKVVIGAAGIPGRTWEALRCMLQDPATRAEVEALRPASAAGASLLWVLDVAMWLRHSNSRAAQQLRRQAGIQIRD